MRPCFPRMGGDFFWLPGLVPPAHQELRLAERCRWSNSAFAWVTTARANRENGVAQWWLASCSRGARNWTCEPGVLHQETETGIDVGGASRHVRISFDGESSLETAERLASEAPEDLHCQTATLPYCSGIQGVKSRGGVFCGKATRCQRPPRRFTSQSAETKSGSRYGSVTLRAPRRRANRHRFSAPGRPASGTVLGCKGAIVAIFPSYDLSRPGGFAIASISSSFWLNE